MVPDDTKAVNETHAAVELGCELATGLAVPNAIRLNQGSHSPVDGSSRSAGAEHGAGRSAREPGAFIELD